jgi:hypothetical protein
MYNASGNGLGRSNDQGMTNQAWGDSMESLECGGGRVHGAVKCSKGQCKVQMARAS